MEFIADGLLIATGLTAGLYCLILSRRLRRLTDSGSGIGAQIESLDRALNDTRAALAETREGVGGLRASAKSSQAQLARDLALAAELAARLETGIAKAEAAIQGLYQAEDRLEAYQEELDRRAGAMSGQAVGEREANMFPDDDPDGAEREPAASVTRVELPSGTSHQVPATGRETGDDDAEALADTDVSREVRPEPMVETGSARADADRPGQGSRNLKAERMML